MTIFKPWTWTVSGVTPDPESHSATKTVFHGWFENEQHTHSPDGAVSSFVVVCYRCLIALSLAMIARRLIAQVYKSRPPYPPTPTDPHEQAWQRLISRAAPQHEFPSLIRKIFSSSKVTDMVKRLQVGDAQTFVDVIDETLDRLNSTSSIRKKCVKLSSEICARHILFPRSLRIELSDNSPGVVLYRGGFGDVSKRKYQGREVAVKTLKVYSTSDLRKVARRFCREFVPWKALQHPNVLPLLGVIMTETEFAMVSEWMPNGNINQFLTVHKDANRFELLCDVTRGLIYMHGQGMVHGDLKGVNILVDQACHARLADFGLLAIIPESAISSSFVQGGTLRWMSPELLNPEIEVHRQTIYSDCYALGMVIYEVLSEHIPFYRHANLVVVGMVVKGEHPGRPRGREGVWFTDDLWKVLEQCWLPQPEGRPSIEDVLLCLENASGVWTPPSPRPSTAPSTTGSSTWELSGMTTAEITDGIGAPSFSQVALSQSLEKPNPKESVRIVGGELHKYPEEHPSLPTSDPLPTPGLSREIINGADTEPNNLGLEDNEGNVFPEPVVQSSTSPTAGDNDGPATGDIDPGSDIAIGNIPEVGSPPHPLVSALRSRRKVSDSGGDTHTHDPSEDRQKRVEKRTRYLLQVLNESTMAEATENPPETVFIDQREENVVVSNGSVPYLTSKPIPNGKTLKKVVITIVSRYMESSSYNRNCGARSGGSMWFELSVGPSPGGSGERWRSEVARNLHARVGFQEYTIEISDRGLYEEAESGDVLTVWALAKSTWRTENRVKKVTIRCIVE